ncbi:MAG TPA: MFS transporter [Thermus scotoductus]|uniref:MFS transporter n=1 Tax=Thermus scotoductus TaxID=37636 RepID=A0A348XRZ5_THESC|nr:MFS transporter [Thermus scotoductus]RTI02772.1 MFS transporter [Thermus scotoductus]HAR69557.1 MFS transporter [Thermus scotoductus]
MKVLGHKAFARLILSYLVSQAGSKVHRVALLVLVYLLTEKALWVSLVLGVQLVGTVVFSPLLSAWADTQDRKRLLVWSDLLRAPLVALIPLLGAKSLPILLLLVFLIELLRDLHDPIQNAVVPDLVPKEEVDEANSLVLLADRLSEVLFVGAAGVLVAAVGPAFAFYLDAATYLASGLILLGLPSLKPQRLPKAAFFARVKEGIGHLAGHPALRRAVGTLFVAAAFGSVETALGVVLAIKWLKVGSAGFGFMEAAMALGAILGGLAIPYLLRRLPRERLFLLALFLFGLFEASIGAFPLFAWVLLAFFISGFLNMAFIVPARSILQLNTPQEMRGRIFAAFSAVMNAAVLLGTLWGGALEGWMGAPRVFLLAGAMVSLAAGYTLLTGGIPAPQETRQTQEA